MRVLSIFPYRLLPLTHGGRVRTYRLAVGLARAGASVDLACPWNPGLPLHPFEREGITIRPFVFAANLLPVILGDRVVPPQLQLAAQPLTRGPRRLLRDCGRYDLVDFHFCAYASWMHRVAKETRVVYSAHNVELDYALAESASGLRRLLGRRLERLERQAVLASDCVVTCTEADRTRLAELYGQPAAAAVVANGFDEKEIRGGDRAGRDESRAGLGLEPEELAILFVGGRAVHNRRAVRFLETEMLPRVQRPARLIVAGECARPRREGRLVALGPVERLQPLLAAADVAVNPVESGSGSNVKLAEYLAAGIPVVTTPIGLRGYEAFAELVTVAQLDHFAEAVQARHAAGARTPEIAELSWSALGRRLHRVYAELLARPRRVHAR